MEIDLILIYSSDERVGEIYRWPTMLSSLSCFRFFFFPFLHSCRRFYLHTLCANGKKKGCCVMCVSSTAAVPSSNENVIIGRALGVWAVNASARDYARFISLNSLLRTARQWISTFDDSARSAKIPNKKNEAKKKVESNGMEWIFFQGKRRGWEEGSGYELTFYLLSSLSSPLLFGSIFIVNDGDTFSGDCKWCLTFENGIDAHTHTLRTPAHTMRTAHRIQFSKNGEEPPKKDEKIHTHAHTSKSIRIQMIRK